MSLLQSIILGIIQGLTEFLPVSSTAHLRIVPALFGWNDPGAAFTAVTQFGTLVAVITYFFKDITQITSATFKSILSRKFTEDQNAKMGWMIGVGTIPIVFFGLVFKKSIETNLRSLYVMSSSLIIIALVMAFAEYVVKKRTEKKIPQKELHNLGWKEVIIVGFAQAVALIPGSSRSGTTISGGLFMGMSRETAARFSFLLSLPSIFAAGVFELIKEREILLASRNDIISLIVATVVAGIVGYLAIAFLLNYLKKHTTYLFIVYRIVLGLFLLILLFSGKL